MNSYEIVVKTLKHLNISVETVDHDPALTIEQADIFIEGIPGVRTKTMFLTNKKKTNFYLIIMDESKKIDLNKFKETVDDKQIKIASENTLFEKMMLLPGVVSPFGLLNDKNHDIKVYIDKKIMNEKRMSFHPNTNTKTIFINTTDLIRFLKSIGYNVNFVDI